MKARRLTTAAAACLCAFAGAVALAGGSAQAADLHVYNSSFGGKGHGSGQFEEPAGIAVNDGTHDVYVVDRGNDRVEEFNATGSIVLAEFDGSTAPTGVLAKPTQIAVDNSGSPLDPSAGDVYVTGEVQVKGETRQVIYKFSETGTYLGQLTKTANGAFSELIGVAVDPTGTLWVYQASNEIDSFSDALENEYLSSVPDAPGFLGYWGKSPGFAVDSQDNLYVNTYFQLVGKLNSSGEQEIMPVDGEAATAIAVDQSSDAVYLDNIETIGAFTSAGALIDHFGSGHLSQGGAIGVDSTNDMLYAADLANDTVQIYSPLVVPDVGIEAVSNLQPTSATLNGTVKPDGLAVTTCAFEYGTEAGVYTHRANCEPSPGSGPGTVAVSAKISGLTRYTVYHYRLVASNENGASATSDGEFRSGGAEVFGEWVTNVSATAATLEAQIEPNGAGTHYYFEYGTTTSYGSDAPEPPGYEIAGTHGAQETTLHLQGLEPATTYHYRIATVWGSETFAGPDRTFTTQAIGAEFTLPDHRQYQLVSPPNKDGQEIIGIAGGTGAGRTPGVPGGSAAAQASAEGTAITYPASGPIGPNPPGNHYGTQLFSTLTANGWETEDITNPQPNFKRFVYDSGEEYRLFSSDLSRVVVAKADPTPEPPLSPEIKIETGTNELWVRNNVTNVFQAILTEEELKLPGFSRPEFVSANADESAIVLTSSTNLLGNAPNGGVYVWSDGQLRLVSVLPGNKEAALGASMPRYIFEDGGRNAVSSDGNEIAWTAPVELPSKTESVQELFTRDMATEQTVQVDAAEAGCLATHECVSGRGEWGAASSDGSRVFFTDPNRLIKGAHEGDLYMFDVADGRLTDLTPQSNGGQAAVLDLNEAGTDVYAVSPGVLTPTANAEGAVASEGARNLYLLREAPEDSGDWSATFIGTLGGGDNLTSVRSSPNGRFFAFMSEASLTGYDNLDVNSGVPDQEVFLYDAESNRLVCASCNPTGARPIGENGGSYKFPSPMNPSRVWEGRWIAGVIPAWNQNFLPEFSGQGSLYESRVVSNSGRVFFDSSDALVPQDVNGRDDVYEYEPDGVGSCVEASGCVALISYGAGSDDSLFVDSSATGNDVFFTTQDKLVEADYDNATDMYDAHSCEGSPCLATPTASPPPCTTTDGCRAAPSPQPTIFGAPPSATFVGAGNVPPNTPPAIVTVPKKTPAQLRAEKLSKALKACKRKRGRKAQAACKRQAERKYGAQSSRRRSK